MDVAHYARQIDAPVTLAWVQQRAIVPAPDATTIVPRTLGRPELDEGPHFSYAMQWFIFTTIALVGYPLILRRNAREQVGEAGPTGSSDRNEPPQRTSRPAGVASTL
ncbi:MAG: hypothetical protein WKF43_08930 [Acidimicrobiales bacterium]